MILVVAAVLVDALRAPRRLLLARRAVGAAAGCWEFPGGKVEAGEAPIPALRRELSEELGVSIEVGVELENPNGPTWPINDRYVMRTWFTEISGGAPVPTGSHDQLRWVGPDELRDLAWLPPDRPIVEALLPWLTKHRSAGGSAV